MHLQLKTNMPKKWKIYSLENIFSKIFENDISLFENFLDYSGLLYKLRALTNLNIIVIGLKRRIN